MADPLFSRFNLGNPPSLRLGLMRPHLVHLHSLVDRLLKAALLLQLLLPHRDVLLLKCMHRWLGMKLLLLPWVLLLLLF